MRKLTLILLLLVLIVAPASAFSGRDQQLNDIVSIAWLEGDELNIALANTSNSRSYVTVSSNTLDSRGRPVFATRQVNVPARTIVVETIQPSTPGRNQPWSVRLEEGWATAYISVQTSDLLDSKDYIVPANTEWELSIDLDFLFQDSLKNKIIIDDYYETDDSYKRGLIRITSFEGGLTQVRGTNTIEYVRPRVTLSMRTPSGNGATTMSFQIRKTDGQQSWRDELLASPTILVYGRNLRYAGPSSSSGSGGSRVPR